MTGGPGGALHLPDGIADCLRQLKTIDFELAYLALLTREGLKPLSRWERPPVGPELELLAQIGLIVRAVGRTVRTGGQVAETVFALAPGYVEAYERRFADRPVAKSPEIVRLEGFLFGYPPCCIERYVAQPYAPNDLPQEALGPLFHWPCRDCRITPLLLPAYRTVAAAIERLG